MSYSEAKLCEVTSSSNKTWRIKKIWGRTSSAVKNLLRKPTGESSHCTVLRCRSLIFRKTDRTFFGNLNHWGMHSTDPGMRRLNIFRWLQLPAPNKLSYSDSRKIHNFLMILFLSVHLNINLVNDHIKLLIYMKRLPDAIKLVLKSIFINICCFPIWLQYVIWHLHFLGAAFLSFSKVTTTPRNLPTGASNSRLRLPVPALASP